MQDRSISISDALELLQYCTNTAKYGIHVHRLLSIVLDSSMPFGMVE